MKFDCRCNKIDNFIVDYLKSKEFFKDCDPNSLIKMSKEGFRYSLTKYDTTEIYLIGLLEDENITIPEYIDNYKVIKLGRRLPLSRGYIINGEYVKHLTIQHEFDVELYTGSYYYLDFSNLETLTFIDFFIL